MLIQNTNPVTVAPDSNRVRRGFAREDLLTVVHEQFMTETAAMADIVLPATTFLEHDDVYAAGGHSHLQIGRRIVTPPGECRSNHEVICALAARLGAEHPGFGMTAFELVDATLRESGYEGAESVAAGRWVDRQPPFRTAHFLDGFQQPGGRFRFAPDWSAIGPLHSTMPRLPDHWECYDGATERLPYRLVTAPARQFLNTSFTETPTSLRREGRPTGLLHPVDAAKLGVTAGDVLRLGNSRGQVVLHAAIGEGQQPGTVIVESVWPNAAFIGGIGINALTSDEPAFPNGGAVFHDTAVWVRAEAATLAAAAD
jgi:anaerobic selenocysteine-containing dehydrogenase